MSGARRRGASTLLVAAVVLAVVASLAPAAAASAAPVVVIHPQDVYADYYDTATFTSIATGDPQPTALRQQSDDAGATWVDSGMLTPTSVAEGWRVSWNVPFLDHPQDGRRYRVVWTNVEGSATTDEARLWVSVAPTGIQQPVTATVDPGEVATFTSTAVGSPAPTTRWQTQAPGASTWEDLDGATDPTLSVLATPEETGRRYRAEFTNTSYTGTTRVRTSNAAELRVNQAPTITLQPVDQVKLVGQSARFTVGWRAFPTPTRTWERSTDGGATWTDLQTSATSILVSTQVALDGAQYRYTATNAFGSATSDVATLRVGSRPSVTTQPTDTLGLDGEQVSLTAAATGLPAPTVQWYRRPPGGSSTAIAGATDPTLLLTLDPSLHGSTVFARFSNDLGSADSDAATLSVDEPYVPQPPVVVEQPEDATSSYPASRASFAVQATGTPPLSYQWQQSTDDGETWAATAGIGPSGNVLELATAPVMDGRLYRVVVSSPHGTATSDPARLRVAWPAAITAQPSDQTVVLGDQVTFSVEATGYPNTYRWQRGVFTGYGTTWTDVEGATDATYTFTAHRPGFLESYRVVIDNPHQGSSLVSDPAAYVAEWGPTFTEDPEAAVVAEGATAAFQVEIDAEPSPDVRWERSDDEGATWATVTGETTTTGAFDGPTTTSELPVATTAADDGAWYRVVATHPLGTATSAVAMLRVDATVARLAPLVVDGGDEHTCSLVDGTARCWGENGAGQVGDGTTARALLPVPVDVAGTAFDGASVRGVAGGQGHSCAAGLQGRLACWGDNSQGQLGDGTTTDAAVPTDVATEGTILAGARIAQVEAGRLHSCALTVGGQVACWGDNAYGQLGDGTKVDSTTPVALATAGTPLAGRRIAVIDAGELHTCAIARDGAFACWGNNSSVELGNRSGAPSTVPVSPRLSADGLVGGSVRAVAAARNHTCVATAAGELVCWGNNRFGQLGDGTTAPQIQPERIPLDGTALEGKAIVELAAGHYHTCARASDGTVACWGANGSGELGDGTTTDRPVPTAVAVAGTALAVDAPDAVAAGAHHTCVRTAGGELSCWGRNSSGQLGDGTLLARSSPAPSVGAATVPGPPRAVAAVAGDASAQVSWQPPEDDGGSPVTGYLVTPWRGTTALDPIPFAAGATGGVVTGLANGESHTFTVAARNVVGVGPDSAPSNAVTPVAPPDAAPADLAAGGAHTCALDGPTLRCWGAGGRGQLGRGATTDAAAPVAVQVAATPLEGHVVTDLAAGGEHTCAVLDGGGIACWGANGSGQLGTGTTADAATPVAVELAGSPLDGRTPQRVVAGEAHTCAVATDGTIACWGANAYGQLGDGTRTSSAVPVAVATAGTPLEGRRVTALAAGRIHTCALTSDGVVACWGNNSSVELGNRSGAGSTIPVSPHVAAGGLQGRPVVALAAGRNHTCVATADGAVLCWGNNRFGQHGDGTTQASIQPVEAPLAGTALDGKAIVALTSGHHHTCARADDGTVACWGRGASGQIGVGSNVDQLVPVAPSLAGTPLAGRSLASVAAGTDHTCVRATDGTLACWGANGSGQLGDGTTTARSVAVDVVASSG